MGDVAWGVGADDGGVVADDVVVCKCVSGEDVGSGESWSVFLVLYAVRASASLGGDIVGRGSTVEIDIPCVVFLSGSRGYAYVSDIKCIPFSSVGRARH